ncbi:riboflavin kinase [Amycolatopsis methanolica]|uniref:riboflavin kinase n=1 Tax=Amycolatopsis methanolica TaxID=1814 RepID=UPI003430CD1F
MNEHVLCTVSGVVVIGAQRGRTLGFPTANVDQSPASAALPPDGVYAGLCDTGEPIDGRASFAAAISVGTNPTFNGTERTVEAHLLDFAGDLYGRTLTVHFLSFIRGMRRFDSVDELVRQMHDDRRVARSLVARSVGGKQTNAAGMTEFPRWPDTLALPPDHGLGSAESMAVRREV